MKRIAIGVGAAASGVWLVSRLWRRPSAAAARRPQRGPHSDERSGSASGPPVETSAPTERSQSLLSGTSADFDLALEPPPPLRRRELTAPDTGAARDTRQSVEGVSSRSRQKQRWAELPSVEAFGQPGEPPVKRMPGILDPADFEAARAGREGAPLALVADDDHDIRTLAAHLLERCGFEVMTAADGDEALRLVIEHRPAVCVLDWMMPKRSGLDVLETLRSGAQTTSTPVLLLTARAASSDVARGLKAGADGYLTKPFTADELRERVEELVQPRAA